jgi:FAS-associated factor 2
LGNREIIDFINNTFIFWACSKNLPEGRKVFNALKAKRCPFLGLIVLRNNKMTLVARMEGPIGKIYKKNDSFVNHY